MNVTMANSSLRVTLYLCCDLSNFIKHNNADALSRVDYTMKLCTHQQNEEFDASCESCKNIVNVTMANSSLRVTLYLCCDLSNFFDA
jgi:hypothetical protein